MGLIGSPSDLPQWMKASLITLALKELARAQMRLDPASQPSPPPPAAICGAITLWEHRSKHLTPYLIPATSWAQCSYSHCLPMFLTLSASMPPSPLPLNGTRRSNAGWGISSIQEHPHFPTIGFWPQNKLENTVKNQEVWEPEIAIVSFPDG